MKDHSQTSESPQLQPPLFGEFRESEEHSPSRYAGDDATEHLLTALFALYRVEGLGLKTLQLLYDASIVHEIIEGDKVQLEEHIKSLPGISKRLYGRLGEFFTNRSSYIDKARDEVIWLRQQGITFIPKGHPKYPKSFQRLVNPPRWIFCVGNVDVLSTDPIVAVVGTRDASSVGLKLAYSCGIQLARRNVVVLSGLAKGIDERAHSGAADAFGQSIAVLGNGILQSIRDKQELPQQIVDTGGVIVSEYFPDSIPSRTTYLRRNELQAALAKVVIPVECPSLESGTAATIRRAMKIKTPVVGVSLEGYETDNTRKTKEVLGKLNIRSFAIANNNSLDFWNYMQELIPSHDWSTDPTARQDRVIEYLADVAIRATRRVEFDRAAVERLHLRLKKALIEK